MRFGCVGHIETLIDECTPFASVAEPNWRCVSTELDEAIDHPPFHTKPCHLKINLGGHIATSLGIILRKH